MARLPDAPATPWDSAGALQFGTFRGECTELDFGAHFGLLRRVKAQKRWLWAGILAEDYAVGLAVVRTGYAANVFCWIFDRTNHTFLMDISRVRPRFAVRVADTPANDGEVVHYQMLGDRVSVRRDAEVWHIKAQFGEQHLQFRIVEDAAPATAICPAAPGELNVTRKQALASAAGTIPVGKETIPIEGIGLLDHSHGMLSGETIWHWAIGAGKLADGRNIGFNIVDKFNGGLENTIWLDGEPSAAGAATFEIPDDRSALWRVVGDRVDLTMEPEGIRAQELDLGLIVSDYQQPLGIWRGTIDGHRVDASGVAEFHRSVW